MTDTIADAEEGDDVELWQRMYWTIVSVVSLASIALLDWNTYNLMPHSLWVAAEYAFACTFGTIYTAFIGVMLIYACWKRDKQTVDIQAELSKREGVETYVVEPYEEYSITIDGRVYSGTGPAIITVNID